MSDDALNRRLKTLIAFRVFFVTVLLGSFFVFQIGYKIFPFPSTVLHLIVLLYALSILYALLLGKAKAMPLAYAQVLLDATAIVALIFLTGGIESWFSTILMIIIIAAAVVINRRAGYVTATYSSILYGTLVDLQFYGLLPLPHNPLLSERDFLYNIFTHIVAMYLMAYLAGYLTSRLEQKDIDLEDLTLFNREVIENTPSGLFTTDLAGRILIFNRAAEEITGIGRPEAHGRSAKEVFPFVDIVKPRTRFEGIQGFGGKSRVIGLTVSGMRDTKGAYTGFIGTFQDLTEIKRMQEEIKRREKWAAIGELSANIAHEIRNPLASLKGSIEMLREDSIGPEQKEKLYSIAISEMDRLNHVIADFLIYSRPSDVEPESFDLNAALNKTVSLLQSKKPDNVTITREYSGEFGIKADPHKLEQVFLNLGLNALEAMPGGGELRLRTQQRGRLAEVTFSDTGTGIRPEEQEKVFFPFFTTKSDGTGLGLSIAHRIVEAHGGRILVTSSPADGTSFRITLPVGDNDKG